MPVRQIAVVTSLGVKIGCGLALIGLAARWLDAAGFVFFVQFGFLLALGNLVATGGVIHGVVRSVAAGPTSERAVVLGTALQLSTAIGALVFGIALLFNDSIANLLVGDGSWGWLVIALAPLATIAGQGQIIGGYLTGLGRATANMVIQTIAISMATAAALVALWFGNATLAILGFAGALALQAPLACFWLWRAGHYQSGMLWALDRQHRRNLLRFGYAFVLTATAMPTALFLLRNDYRSDFGAVALAAWLAANRLSDVTTQLLGVYMGQIYLPEQATAEHAADPRRWLKTYFRHLAIAIALMSAGVALFLLAPAFWVRIGLGPTMIYALTIISLYMIGDIARSWPSINQHSLLARGWTGVYALHEVVAAVVFVAFALACKGAFGTLAPAVAYVATNGIVGAAGFLLLLWLHRHFDSPVKKSNQSLGLFRD